MLVYPDGSIAGTVGGGASEYLVIKEALEAIKEGKSRLIGYALALEAGDLKATGAVCGGEVQMFIEVISRPFNLIILGGGHVGLKLSELCGFLDVPNIIVDNRKDYALKERFPYAVRVIFGDYAKVWDELSVNENTCIVILTHGHIHDGVCLERALSTNAKYIGMIGSAQKVKEKFLKLREQGKDPAEDKRVFSPIGLDLGGNTPAEIALSIMAEILKLEYGRSGKHMRENKFEIRNSKQCQITKIQNSKP
jgi:xanthine dehydrogenase accessory factor